MVKHGILIFARLKPSKSKSGVFEASQDSGGHPKLSFVVPKKEAEGFVNNKKESYNFRFDHIFEQNATQDEVFEQVAKGVIDNVLAGYNGTVFAYGQTGSGKTFTITGGAERYSDRGLIPRSLSYIYKHQQQNPDKLFTTQVTYMEIYNEGGHDLLDQQHQGTKLEDFPKVRLVEDSDGHIALKNLSVHDANNEESALNLLFLGDTNRMIAETPMNMASTRSHCIFTIHITTREPGSAVIRRSKLHLVDLAGSERIKKTGVGGTLLAEAKYINLSLHFLEQVIVALTEKGRSHIPYRNSMMTSILRDSLGGNCMTSMIATCSVDRGNIDESISTCRFAQRVALIKNDAMLNEELSPKLMISRLQQQVKDLKDELQLATGEARTDELSDEEKATCAEQVKSYVEQGVPLSIGADMRKIQLCFHLLKDLVTESRQELADKSTQSSTASRQAASPSISGQPTQQASKGDIAHLYLPTEVIRLQELLVQRDNEINILVNMLKREKRRLAEAMVKSSPSAGGVDRTQHSEGDTTSTPVSNASSSLTTSGTSNDTGLKHTAPMSPSGDDGSDASAARHKALQDLSVGQREAYEVFRQDYKNTPAMEESKAVLKERYAVAKQLGEAVNAARLDINTTKKDLEQHRVSLAVRGVAEGQSGIAETMDSREVALRELLQEAKSRFKSSLNELKELKAEIDHRKHLLEATRIQMLKDFQIWWRSQAQRSADESRMTPRQPLSAKFTSPPTSSWTSSQSTSKSASWSSTSTEERHRPTSSRTSSRPASSSMAARFPRASSDRPHPQAPSSTLGYGTGADSGVSSQLRSDTESYYSASDSYRGVSVDLESSSSAASSRTSRSTSRSSQASGSVTPRQIALTGDSRADADIIAFMKARQGLLEKGQR